jgi:arylsulfatase A-like enzyme
VLRRPALAALLALPLLAGCGGGPDATEPRSLVLVTIDTLRADHVGAYGYPRPTTPFLDRLAERGVVFENAFSASSHTAPSHASLMTSRQPFQHGLLANGGSLPAGSHTLADLLAAAGYDTAAFTSVSFLVELGQGFGHFDAAWRSGDETVDAAIAWLDARPAGAAPLFLWVHLYDPHRLPGPREKLQPDAELLRAAGPEARRRFLDHLAGRGLPPDFYPGEDAVLERYDLYDAGVRFADRQVGRLYHQVEESEPEARWIVTSDHGEGLGNHHYDDHGKYLYDEQLRVPLIVAGAGGPPRRVERMVRLVDVYPTVAAWLGGERGSVAAALIPPRYVIQGYPLFEEPAAAGPLPPRLAYAERRPKGKASHQRRWEDGDILALRGADFKYIYHSEGGDELYDLAADPLELDNRIAASPDRAEVLRGALLGYLDGSGRRAGSPASAAGDEDSEHEAELRALGYL